MRQWRKWQVGLWLLVAAAFMGSTGQLGCVTAAVKNFNPCGTILNCDPYEWDIMMLDGNFPDWDLDPTCTIPGGCGDGVYPYGGGGTTASTETTDTTPGTGGFGF